jgi:hypothetical protein
MHFTNYAGRSDVDKELKEELTAAGITVVELPISIKEGEVETSIIGSMYGWKFERNWRYWVCSGPGIPLEQATRLHNDFGKEARV